MLGQAAKRNQSHFALPYKKLTVRPILSLSALFPPSGPSLFFLSLFVIFHRPDVPFTHKSLCCPLHKKHRTTDNNKLKY